MKTSILFKCSVLLVEEQKSLTATVELPYYLKGSQLASISFTGKDENRLLIGL